MTESQSLVERLAGEAAKHADRTGHLVLSKKWFEARDAKFAELVARECAAICDETTEHGALDLHGETKADASAAAIRQRFGVGE